MAGSGGGGEAIGGAVLIAGPTASGKSALALDLAAAIDGVVINADSMQVYDVLSVVTARPSSADLSIAPHHLYGHVDPARAYSVGQWLRDVDALARSGALSGRRAIFVGGTGLYFRALLGGLADMPDIPASIRDRWRARLIGEGAAALHHELERRDPVAAARLRPSDGQRIVRALEIVDATGRSIVEWQAGSSAPLVDPASALRLVLEPDRNLLHRRIEDRFDRMLDAGAAEEVAALSARALDPALPAMRAIGVPEIAAMNEGIFSRAKASDLAKAATRQYAKRQLTWFRNQLGNEWLRLRDGDAIARARDLVLDTTHQDLRRRR